MLSRTSKLPFFFFFNDTATTEIYTLSLHDALPILKTGARWLAAMMLLSRHNPVTLLDNAPLRDMLDRKSTRLNSSHGYISYAVFCLKKKKKHRICLCSRQNTLQRQY